MRTKLSIWTAMVAILALAAFAPPAQAQSVVGTSHDLSSSTGPGATTNVNRVCVFCHTPHQAAAANSQDPLWNHTISGTASYGVYASDTLNATPTNIGGATAGTATVSNLCLSCHDGTVAVQSLYNPPNEVASVTITAGGNVSAAGLITGTPNVGTDLSNDHPVNFDYDNALFVADGGLVDPTDADVAPLLFGGTVQCASCHDPHDDTYNAFLVDTNVGSALCLKCHVK